MTTNNTVKVKALPFCDLCQSMAGVETPARYDGRTVFGPWANMCPDCFVCYGVGSPLHLVPPSTSPEGGTNAPAPI